jgi:hypothetical protein
MKRPNKTKNKILPIPAGANATPANPGISATIATIRNTEAQYSIATSDWRIRSFAPICEMIRGELDMLTSRGEPK